jgi:hypothetical protein
MAMSEEEFRGYDLIFSNSFFEHLEHRAAQARLAKIIVASGVPYFIQVPNKRSPVDPHFPSPFVPFFAVSHRLSSRDGRHHFFAAISFNMTLSSIASLARCQAWMARSIPAILA